MRGFELYDMGRYHSGCRRWVLRGHKGMDIVSNNSEVDCGVNMMLNRYKGMG